MNNEYTIVIGSPLLRSGLTLTTTVSAKYAPAAALETLEIVREINTRLDDDAELAEKERVHLEAVETGLGVTPGQVAELRELAEKHFEENSYDGAPIDTFQRVTHEANTYHIIFTEDEITGCWVCDADEQRVIDLGPDAGQHILDLAAVPVTRPDTYLLPSILRDRNPMRLGHIWTIKGTSTVPLKFTRRLIENFLDGSLREEIINNREAETGFLSDRTLEDLINSGALYHRDGELRLALESLRNWLESDDIDA